MKLLSPRSVDAPQAVKSLLEQPSFSQLRSSQIAGDVQHVLVDDDVAFERFIQKLYPQRISAWDIEHDGKELLQARPVTNQFYWGEDTAYMVSEKYLPRLQPWFDTKPTLIGYSIKGDLHTSKNVNTRILGPVQDALVTDYMADENVKVAGQWEESLKVRHADIFGHVPRKGWAKEFGKLGADKVIAKEGYDRILPYGCLDAVENWEVFQHSKKELEQLPWRDGMSMFDHFEKYEAPYTRTLFNMERRGCYIDVDFLQEQAVIATDLLEQKEGEFYRLARQSVDLDQHGFTEKLMGSWQQIGKLFYDVLGYPEQFHLVFDKKEQKKVKKRTTNDEAMETLAKLGFPLATIKNEWKKLEKLKGTYIDGILSREHLRRIHTEFIQAFTLTGRLSSRNPNLQNIPRPANDPFHIREAFIPSPGMLMLSLDYSQIEVRIAAQMSGDEGLIEVCKASDIYIAMAALLFPSHPASFWRLDASGKPVVEEAALLRQTVKAIVLGVIFGKQAKSIAEDLRISEDRAEKFIAAFFKRFPKLHQWMERQKRNCRQRGYVRTMTGRYRRIPDINLPMRTKAERHKNWYKVTHAERQSLNSPIQGSAFDVMMLAQLNIEKSGICEENGGHMILSVHDEILFEFPKEKSYTGKLLINELKPRIQEIMEHPFESDLKVPLPVSGSVGVSWGACK